MLMALLYGNDDQILAAAPACDQAPYGAEYWIDCHEANFNAADIFETAYVSIERKDLIESLLMLGIDQSIDAATLTLDVESTTTSRLQPRKAA